MSAMLIVLGLRYLGAAAWIVSLWFTAPSVVRGDPRPAVRQALRPGLGVDVLPSR